MQGFTNALVTAQQSARAPVGARASEHVMGGSSGAPACAEYFRTMVEVVHHLHQLGVMHRDIKPENFLLTTPGDDAVLKLCDFGLSAYWCGARLPCLFNALCSEQADAMHDIMTSSELQECCFFGSGQTHMGNVLAVGQLCASLGVSYAQVQGSAMRKFKGQLCASTDTQMRCRRPGQKLSSVVGSSYYVSPEV